MITEEIIDSLVWNNNWCTKNGDLGDAMSANAALALVLPKDRRIDDFVSKSFIGQRPYRSPIHAQNSNIGQETSFSRDHCLSLAWYSLWSGHCWPLISISQYANAHYLKIGKEGSYSQHGVTPNVMWAFSVVCERNGEENGLPWYYSIWPSRLIASIQLISAKSVAVGYRLNLCAEMALLAKITNKWNSTWQKVADTCAMRQPDNLYYKYVQGRHNTAELQNELQNLMHNYEPSHEWCWCWMNKNADGKLLACGQDLLLLDKILSISKGKP